MKTFVPSKRLQQYLDEKSSHNMDYHEYTHWFIKHWNASKDIHEAVQRIGDTESNIRRKATYLRTYWGDVPEPIKYLGSSKRKAQDPERARLEFEKSERKRLNRKK